MKNTILIIYTTKDKSFLPKVQENLGKIEGVEVESQELKYGVEWNNTAQQKMDKAMAVLPILSPDFTRSSFYRYQLKELYKRYSSENVLLIPITLRECSWRFTAFSDVPCYPKEALMDFSEKLDEDKTTSILEEIKAIISKKIIVEVPPVIAPRKKEQEPSEEDIFINEEPVVFEDKKEENKPIIPIVLPPNTQSTAAGLSIADQLFNNEKWAEAQQLYQTYLEKNPAADNSAKIKARIRECENAKKSKIAFDKSMKAYKADDYETAQHHLKVARFHKDSPKLRQYKGHIDKAVFAQKHTQNSRRPIYIAIGILLGIGALFGFFLMLQDHGVGVDETEYKILKELSESKENTMIFVEGGTFIMGGSYTFEKPKHQVTVKGFYISKYETTFVEYDAYCKAVGIEKPKDLGLRGAKPVIYVSWDDALEYANWKSEQEGYEPVYSFNGSSVVMNSTNGYRLPTEAEWEYAAKGGKHKESYIFSGSLDREEVSWNDLNSGKRTHTVGTKKPNILGVYDMTGNVWEWCWDYYDEKYYKGSPINNPRGPASGTKKVVRGGSMYSETTYLRVSNRMMERQNDKAFDTGFRLVRNE